ncbi:MAG: DegV family protein [Christensenellaceae bacterium]|jgi:DegV family protein with EDD domain
MIQIVTDSACDLTKEEADALGISLVPLMIHFGEETFRGGYDLSIPAFYEKLKTVESLPTTSQPSPAVFEACFSKYLAEGKEIIGIFLSSELSGTYQSAMLAKQTLGSEKIHIVDSRMVTVGMQILIREALSLKEMGLSAGKIAKRLEGIAPRVRIFGMVDTLKYLHLGGRLSAASMIIGNILGVTPIVCVKEGKVFSVGKVRGKKAGFRFLLKQLEEHTRDISYPLALAHAADEVGFEELTAFFAPYIQGTPHFVGEIGVSVGTHTGPGVLGLAYVMAQA